MISKLLRNAVLGIALSWLAYTWWSPLPQCRCRPWEPCWPSHEEWSALNQSIEFNLVRLMPIASVCYAPLFNQTACEEVTRLSKDSGWRASQPGALQDWVWEAGRSVAETCPLGSQMINHTSCHQGRIPLYSAAVNSTQQIQTVVLFAKRHRLRLTIRNTGHDLAGRSSAANSLQIHTHRMKWTQFHKDFRLNGSEESFGPAVSVGAGVQMGELYAKAAEMGYIIVGGDCPTVGVIGGFLQGGGVSDFLSFHYGLAVDNVLEFEVVTSDGEVVLANSIQNPNLFWALRGGGGGTFGVVTRATMRVYPDVPAITAEVDVHSSYTHGKWPETLTFLFTMLQLLNQKKIGGQLVVSALHDSAIHASLKMVFPSQTEKESVDLQMQPLFNKLKLIESDATYKLTNLPAISANYRKIPDIHADNDYGILGSSVVISNSLFNTSKGPAHVGRSLAQLPMVPGDLLFTSNLGGKVMENEGLVTTSIHPGWRDSAQLINYVRRVEPSLAGRAAAQHSLTNIYMPLLYAIDPATQVSYRNVGDSNEKRFQQVYWGEAYVDLLQVKRMWDRSGLFFSKLGVGSEEWDSEGMCRLRNVPIGWMIDIVLRMLARVV